MIPPPTAMGGGGGGAGKQSPIGKYKAVKTEIQISNLERKIAKGTTDPRVEFISQVQTKILIK